MTDVEVEKVMAALRPHLRRAGDRITAEVNAEIERALAPAKGLGLLPLRIGGSDALGGRDATTMDRVHAAATWLAKYDREITNMAGVVARSPKLREMIRPGESVVDFAARMLAELAKEST